MGVDKEVDEVVGKQVDKDVNMKVGKKVDSLSLQLILPLLPFHPVLLLQLPQPLLHLPLQLRNPLLFPRELLIHLRKLRLYLVPQPQQFGVVPIVILQAVGHCSCFLEELVLSVDATWWGEPFYTSESDNTCCVAIFRHAFEAAIGNQRLVPLGMCETLTKTTTIVLPSSSSSSGENPPPLGTC